MIDYQLLKQEIENEYELAIQGIQRDKDRLYELLGQYTRRTIEMTIMEGSRVKQEDFEEIMQNTMLAIFESGMNHYNKQGKSFAGYCCMIAKNKAIDFVNKRRRETITRITYATEEEYSLDEQIDYLLYQQSEKHSKSPENRIIDMETHIERIEMLKRFLHIIMNQKDKAYKTVGCCYTIILFQLFNTKTKELSSPAWAFEELSERTIQYSADAFIREVNKRLRQGKINWGEYFWDSMESEEKGSLICDIIFGEHFKRKDLENWSIRFRNKLKEEICYDFC